VIHFIDEDWPAWLSWTGELEVRGWKVNKIWNADDAYQHLTSPDAPEVDLVIIDVMLAVKDHEGDQFTDTRTAHYLQTGLCLLEDLVKAIPAPYPGRAVFLSNMMGEETKRATERSCRQYQVDLWRKSQFESPVMFADHVEAHIRKLNERGVPK
jgi:hypothetical protein